MSIISYGDAQSSESLAMQRDGYVSLMSYEGDFKPREPYELTAPYLIDSIIQNNDELLKHLILSSSVIENLYISSSDQDIDGAEILPLLEDDNNGDLELSNWLQVRRAAENGSWKFWAPVTAVTVGVVAVASMFLPRGK